MHDHAPNRLMKFLNRYLALDHFGVGATTVEWTKTRFARYRVKRKVRDAVAKKSKRANRKHTKYGRPKK